MTIDIRNIIKARESTRLSITRQEDIKTKMQNAKVFSNEFKVAFLAAGTPS